jgi:hypothetical protein
MQNSSTKSKSSWFLGELTIYVSNGTLLKLEIEVDACALLHPAKQ